MLGLPPFSLCTLCTICYAVFSSSLAQTVLMGSVACATKKLDGAQWQTAVLGGA
jgi:hypothetical protein